MNGMKNKPASKRINNHRRRGTAYVLALAITTMLITLGIAATQIARGAMQENTLEQDQATAALVAQFSQDYMHKLLSDKADWRDTAPNSSWRLFAIFDDTAVWFAYIDQIDGDIKNDATQPFMLYTMAIKGDTRRVYRVEIVPDSDGNLTRNLDKFEQVAFEELF